MKYLVYGLTNNWGGVQAIVMAMIKNLSVSDKFDIIVSEEKCAYEDNYKTDNIKFLHIPSWGGDRKGFKKNLKQILLTDNYDFVWINGCIMSNKDIISITKQVSSAKIITHSHGSSFESSNKIKRNILLFLHYLNRNYYLNNIDYPCMCSYKSGEWFYGKKYMRNHKVHFIKNGIEISNFLYNEEIRCLYRRELGLSKEFAVFHAGRLTAVKNQKRIISIFAELIQNGINSKLFFAGDGELREELKLQAELLNVADKVVFLGLRDDINKLYSAMDVMLLPSFHEGFPVTLVEAQATGLPCIVSDRVSRETDINNLIKYLSIDTLSNKEWVDALINVAAGKTINRKERGNEVFERGYNIIDVCEEFKSFVNAR